MNWPRISKRAMDDLICCIGSGCGSELPASGFTIQPVSLVITVIIFWFMMDISVRIPLLLTIQILPGISCPIAVVVISSYMELSWDNLALPPMASMFLLMISLAVCANTPAPAKHSVRARIIRLVSNIKEYYFVQYRQSCELFLRLKIQSSLFTSRSPKWNPFAIAGLPIYQSFASPKAINLILSLTFTRNSASPKEVTLAALLRIAVLLILLSPKQV